MVVVENDIDMAKRLAVTIPLPRDAAPGLNKLTVKWIADVDRREVVTAAAPTARRDAAAGQCRNN
jgi:hypothetical protein